MENYYIIITIALIVVLVGVIFWRLKEKPVRSQINKDLPESALNKLNSETENKQRKALLVGIVIMIVLAGLFFYMQETKNNPGSFSDDSNSSVAMLPIWIAVWVTLMMKKKKGEPKPEQKKILLVIVGLTLLAVFGTVSYWILNTN